MSTDIVARSLGVAFVRTEPLDEDAFKQFLGAPLEAAKKQIFACVDAHIYLSYFHPESINYTSFYVINRNLKFHHDLHRFLLEECDIDTYNLNDKVILRDTKEGRLRAFVPPIVIFYKELVVIEKHRQSDREPPPHSILTIPILKDGRHRMWNAMHDDRIVRCIAVHGIDSNHKPYAYPNGIEDVQLVDHVPASAKKKYFRRKVRYSNLLPLSALRRVGGEIAKQEWNRK